MKIFCVKCKTKTDTSKLTHTTAKNGRAMVKGVCDVCGGKKAQIVKK